jgi:hypothetical protein
MRSPGKRAQIRVGTIINNPNKANRKLAVIINSRKLSLAPRLIKTIVRNQQSSRTINKNQLLKNMSLSRRISNNKN